MLCCKEGRVEREWKEEGCFEYQLSPPVLGARLNLVTLVSWAQCIEVSSGAAMSVARLRPPRGGCFGGGRGAAAGGADMIRQGWGGVGTVEL